MRGGGGVPRVLLSVCTLAENSSGLRNAAQVSGAVCPTAPCGLLTHVCSSPGAAQSSAADSETALALQTPGTLFSFPRSPPSPVPGAPVVTPVSPDAAPSLHPKGPALVSWGSPTSCHIWKVPPREQSLRVSLLSPPVAPRASPPVFRCSVRVPGCV